MKNFSIMSDIEKNKPPACPVDAFLKIFGQRWSAYILHMLNVNGPIRFGELKRLIAGISQKVLTQKLRELEEAKIIYRHYKNAIPPEVTYGLTQRGLELIPTLNLISELAHRWRSDGNL
ncbi:MAG: helix-turn-helix transcriptional regulator [Candidatus Jidaibacter sp.]|jgi:DNA-binding HxlR family transcriptional regulator|nr:helix-turn-helix transcriptional regulator [Candidatus Jidaibacter sp.]